MAKNKKPSTYTGYGFSPEAASTIRGHLASVGYKNMMDTEGLCHHCTWSFPGEHLPPIPDGAVEVIGYSHGGLWCGVWAEAAVLKVGSATHSPRGNLLHVTLGINKHNGGKPFHSNKLLELGWQKIAPLDVSHLVFPAVFTMAGSEVVEKGAALAA